MPSVCQGAQKLSASKHLPNTDLAAGFPQGNDQGGGKDGRQGGGGGRADAPPLPPQPDNPPGTVRVSEDDSLQSVPSPEVRATCRHVYMQTCRLCNDLLPTAKLCCRMDWSIRFRAVAWHTLTRLSSILVGVHTPRPVSASILCSAGTLLRPPALFMEKWDGSFV